MLSPASPRALVSELVQALSSLGWTGEVKYVNSKQGLEMPQNPVLPRFKELVRIFKHCKKANMPVDETTIIELLNPLERAEDVRDMALYLGKRVSTKSLP